MYRELRFLGPGDPDHLDPASAHHIRPGQLVRALRRQLYAVPATRDATGPEACFQPVPDVARGFPAVSPDLRTCTVELRDDVFWDTRPPRPVTAADFVRGIGRLADPAVGGDGRTYFSETLRGMREYCADFDAAFGDTGPT